MIKRITSLFMVLLLMVTLLPQELIAHAAGSAATVAVESVTAAPGSTVDVNVRITNNPGVLGATLTLSYDEALTLTGAKNGDAFGALTMTPPGKMQSPCNFVWDGTDVTEIKDGTILTLTFAVSDQVESGRDLNVSVSCAPGAFTDRNLNSVEVQTVNGAVSVLDYLYGDLDGDTIVNSRDTILLRRFIAGGYDVSINDRAADVDCDDSIGTKDIIIMRRHIAGGYGEDYDLLPFPGGKGRPVLTCEHTLEATPMNAATCTEAGNIAYWHCTKCDKYFSNAEATAEISLEGVVLNATGHTPVTIPAVPATYEAGGMTEGSKCSVCDTILIAPTPTPPLEDNSHTITYNIANGDTYITRLIAEGKVVSPDTDRFNEETGLASLPHMTIDGYRFLGWFNGAGSNATQITSIPAGTKTNQILYAHWEELPYEITYKLYQTPLQDTIADRYKTYTVSRGLADLPNPTLYNYVFLGWYLDDGTEVTSIPAGTTGNITLNAYWTSKRNLAKSISNPTDPIVMEDPENGVIYFAYEIGTIENIPLSDPIWETQNVYGLAQQVSETVTTSISTTQAHSISNTISKATVDSSTWTLAEDWNSTTNITEQWAEEHGMSVEEAEEQSKTSSGTYSVTDSNGGAKTKSKTDGTTTVTYDSQNYKHGNSAEFDVKVGGSYSNEGNLTSKVAGTYKLDASVEAGYEQHKETDEHTGKDKTRIKSKVTDNTSTWNKSSTSSQTNTASSRSSVSKALHDTISQTKSYGQSYSSGGEKSESRGMSTTDSTSENVASTLTYSNAQTTTRTTTYTSDGKSEGWYRLVVAGTAHVFGVVGYDVGSKSYFTYTYSVMDDKTKEFLDYSPNSSFSSDDEKSVLPFEIPYFVYEYVTESTAITEGLHFRTNTSTHTAVVSSYTGESADVTVPAFISSGNTAYRVTGIAANAFENANIRAIALSPYIDEIPDAAFKNCVNLQEVSGYFTKIGNEAFSGCTSLEGFTVSSNVSSIGTDAFLNVPQVKVNALKEYTALKLAGYEYDPSSAPTAQQIETAQATTQALIDAALASGAQKIDLDISSIVNGTVLTLDVPEINSFDLKGGGKTYTDLKLTSHAQSTAIRSLTVSGSTRIPLDIYSENLTLEATSITSPGYVLLLHADGTDISLLRDNSLTSSSNEAVVCKDVTLSSVYADYADGVLDVSGNIYCWGTVIESNYLDISNGRIIQIEEPEYSSRIQGSATIYFNANGGTVSQESKTVAYGKAYGSLPVPTKDYYHFLGWYTAETGGTQATEETINTAINDTVLYAHWEVNSTSDWVLESNVPSGAQTINEKWTYNQKYYTTSSSSSLSGWTQYDSSWVWSNYGNWSGWQDAWIGSSDSREVGTQSVVIGYNKKHQWLFHRYYDWWTTKNCYMACAFWTKDCTTYEDTGWLDYPLEKQAEHNFYGTIYDAYSRGAINGRDVYWYWAGERDVDDYNSPIYKTQYRYRDRYQIYTYYFYKTESKTSTNYPSGSNISNIQHWVQYRAK